MVLTSQTGHVASPLVFLREKPEYEGLGSKCGLRPRLDSSPPSVSAGGGEFFYSFLLFRNINIRPRLKGMAEGFWFFVTTHPTGIYGRCILAEFSKCFDHSRHAFPSFFPIFNGFMGAATFGETVKNGVDGSQRIAVFGQPVTKLFKFKSDFARRERVLRCRKYFVNIVGKAGIDDLTKPCRCRVHEVFVFPTMLTNERRKGVHCFSEGQNSLLNTLVFCQE